MVLRSSRLPCDVNLPDAKWEKVNDKLIPYEKIPIAMIEA